MTDFRVVLDKLPSLAVIKNAKSRRQDIGLAMMIVSEFRKKDRELPDIKTNKQTSYQF